MKPRPRNSWLGHWGAALVLLGCLAAGGCSQSAPVEKEQAQQPAEPATRPEELLAKLRGAYRQAKSYTDNTSVVFYAVLRSTGTEEHSPFVRSSVAFQRPNRLHLSHQKYISSPLEEHYQLASDGKIVRSRSKQLPDQVHETAAPLALSLENFVPEPELRRALLEDAIENTLPQVALLLAEEAPVFPGEAEARVLSDAPLDGQAFHRLELPDPAGNRVLWIDRETFLLRRMELPIEGQRAQINARNQFSKIALWIDFQEVTLDSQIDEASFQLAVPEGARRVRRFIPPPGEGPPEYLGKPVGPFRFTTLRGEELTPESLAGKVVVFDFWSTHCAPCKTQTPVLNEVYEHFQADQDVAFFAVSTDGRAVENEQIQQTLARWGGTMPIARDVDSTAYNELQLRQTPTLLLVDRKGHQQEFHVGAQTSSAPLIQAIEQLVEGVDLVEQARAQHADFGRQYQQALEVATWTDSILEADEEVGKTDTLPKVPPRRLPTRFALDRLWETSPDKLLQPADVLVVEAQDGSPRVLALDGGEAVVELDSAGKVVGRHPLPSHEVQEGGFLRSWADRNGKRWTLVSGVGWQRVFVWDDQWELVMEFPDERHAGIGDVLLDDLTGSGTPLLVVGYWGGRGLEAGTMDGRRLWANHWLDHVLQVGKGPATTPGHHSLWCSSTRGTLMQVGVEGKSIQERYLEGQTLVRFASQPEGQHHCGVSVDSQGEYQVFGFAASDKPDWQFALPAAVEVIRLQSVRLPSDEPGWLLVAANGVLHWLTLAGEPLDQMDYGQRVTGVATCGTGDASQLWVTTATQLTAWQVGAAQDTSSEQSKSEQTEAEQSKSEQTEAEQSKSEQAKAEQSKAGEATAPQPSEPADSLATEPVAPAGS